MEFLIETFTLFLSICGRINFLQLARYGKHKEQRYRQQKETLTSISKYLVADGFFAKKPLTDQVIASEMHLISRLRDDADLMYLYKGSQTGKM
jgi:hypothetical protein